MPIDSEFRLYFTSFGLGPIGGPLLWGLIPLDVHRCRSRAVVDKSNKMFLSAAFVGSHLVTGVLISRRFHTSV